MSILKIASSLRGISAALALGAIVGSGASAQDVVTLRTVTPFEATSPLSKGTLLLKEVIERETGGSIVVQILGGPEVVPVQQQFDATRNGVLDVLFAAPYYQGTVPEVAALVYSPLDALEMRKSGFFDALQTAHSERAGLHLLGIAAGQAGTAFRIYLNKPIDKADLSGLRVRISAASASVVEALGGTGVSVPFSDVYTALERGIVDGFVSTYAGIVDQRLHEVTKYVVQAPFYSLNGAVVVNENVWDGLSDEVKAKLEAAIPIYEQEFDAYMSAALEPEDVALRAAGVEFIELPAEEEASLYKKIMDAAWASYAANDPDGAEHIRALASK